MKNYSISETCLLLFFEELLRIVFISLENLCDSNTRNPTNLVEKKYHNNISLLQVKDFFSFNLIENSYQLRECSISLEHIYYYLLRAKLDIYCASFNKYWHQ